MTAKTIELANRLVGGLASENVRWADSIKDFRKQELTLPGDVLLITASYHMWDASQSSTD